MDENGVTLNVKGLDQLLKALKTRQPRARVGVLGSHVSREPGPDEKEQLTNADIGAIHEFGAPNAKPPIPPRSFLRTPIMELLDAKMKASGALDKQALADVIKQGSVVPWMEKIAVLAEAIVQGAFATGGYGEWKPSNMARKQNWQTLVETGQLRDSITHEVEGAT